MSEPTLMEELRALFEPAGVDFALEPQTNGTDRLVLGCGCAVGLEGDRADEIHAYPCGDPLCPFSRALPEALRRVFPETPYEEVEW